MAQKVNLDKLKNEIDSRKKERTPAGSGAAPRDVFLHGLLESLEHGHETASSSLIKTVGNEASIKKGEKAVLPIRDSVPTPAQTPVARPQLVQESEERDHKLFEDMDKMRKQTLADSLNAITGNAPTAAMPSTVNYGGQQMLTSLPAGTSAGGVQINEAALTESVRQIVNNHLVENFAPVLEDAIKNTVIEMYAVERIKDVLNENTDLIEKIVYQTIRKLQNKTKK